MDGERLSDRNEVYRRGDVVVRPARPWSQSVLAVLGHLEAVGFSGAPRPAEADEGWEAVTWIEGEGHPAPWSDEGLFALGGLLRRLHHAMASFRPPPDAVWQDWWARAPAGPIGHGDTGPWNVIARDGLPIAFVDWEMCGPLDPMDELAELLWLNAQFHDDDVAERQGLPPADERVRRGALVLDGYGLATAERAGFTTRMIEAAVRESAFVIKEMGVTPETTEPTHLWRFAWQIRSAGWMVRHRALIERVVEHR